MHPYYWTDTPFDRLRAACSKYASGQTNRRYDAIRWCSVMGQMCFMQVTRQSRNHLRGIDGTLAASAAQATKGLTPVDDRLVISNESSLITFARQTGLTIAQIANAVETVGNKQCDVIKYLHRCNFIREDELHERLRAFVVT
jgi:hypothetical protein